MPLIKTIEDLSFQLLVWKIEETQDELLGLLDLKKNRFIQNILKVKNKEKRLQKIAIQVLLKNIVDPFDLFYQISGKPELKSGHKISISHSSVYVAVMKSDFPCGVDIETKFEQVIKIAKRVFNPIELGYLRNNLAIDYALYWSCKESAYKMLGKKIKNYKTDLSVINLEKKGLAVECLKNQIVSVNFLKEKEYILVYINNRIG